MQVHASCLLNVPYSIRTQVVLRIYRQEATEMNIPPEGNASYNGETSCCEGYSRQRCDPRCGVRNSQFQALPHQKLHLINLSQSCEYPSARNTVLVRHRDIFSKSCPQLVKSSFFLQLWYLCSVKPDINPFSRLKSNWQRRNYGTEIVASKTFFHRKAQLTLASRKIMMLLF